MTLRPFRRRKPKKEDLHFGGKTRSYFKSIEPFVMSYVADRDILYVAFADKNAAEAASAIYSAILHRDEYNPDNVILSSFNYHTSYLHPTWDVKRECPDKDVTNGCGLIAISYDYNEMIERALSNERARDRIADTFGIKDVFYTWIHPHARSKILHFPKSDAYGVQS